MDETNHDHDHDQDEDKVEIEYLGYYSLSDAAKLAEAFEAAGVDYLGDVIDSSGKVSPTHSYHGGTYGLSVWVLISINPAHRDEALRVHQELFGDCLPNYDSSFFKDPQNVDPDDRSADGAS